MEGEVLLIISLPCLWTDGGRISAHLGEPMGWRRSNSRPWPKRQMARWLTNRYLPFKKIKIKCVLV
ncbi:hypothetical protein Hanom_Chr12g01085851 [Helianthus anomalus]